MSLFNFLKDKNADFLQLSENHTDALILVKAAEVGREAKIAVNENRYDDAWKLYHDQKDFYMQHANRYGHTVRQALALDSTIHENLANILRLEGKHFDALIHIVYWVLAGADRPIKSHQKKLQSYFNRCKFKNITLIEAKQTLSEQNALPEFTLAQSIVNQWIKKG
ncbi:hypothetical protein [Aquaspirillum soli]